MDWKAVGALVGPLAPTLGGILGGLFPIPFGGAIGTEAGTILAQALGVAPTPDAVGGALTNDPNAADKIQAAESEAAAKWAGLAAIAQARFQANAAETTSINDTMKAELAAGQPWWAWRNLYGYSVGFECTVTSWIIFYALVWDKSIFTAVSNSFSFFLSWYGMRMGLLGYIHNGSSNEKIAAVTGEAPSIVKTIAKAFKGR